MTSDRNSDIAAPVSKLTQGFIKALKRRERLLPKSTLEQYLNSELEKRALLLESATRFGTPQYFFHEPALSVQIARFNAAFSKHLSHYRVFYALKSNSFADICRRVVAEGMGLDVSSGLELGLALAVGCREIIFSGPGKTDEELRLAVQHRSKVTLLMDSLGELQRLSDILSRKSIRDPGLKVGVRVEHQGKWNKFGIPLKDLGKVLKRAHATEGVEPCGIQFHSSWNLNPGPQIEMMHRIGTFVSKELPVDLWRSMKFLDIGGGFWPEHGEWFNPQNTRKGRLIELLEPEAQLGWRHYYRKASPIEQFASEIAEAFLRNGSGFRHLELWLEPGRWISTPAMHILLRVVDKKNLRTVITDGGTNLLGWERPLSEFIPVINLTKPSLKEQMVRVFGSLCTPYDIWGNSMFGEGIDEGDILLIPDQGAYTYSLRQSFIKPKARVIRYDGHTLEEVEQEQIGILSSRAPKNRK